jgi:carbohydrate-selective porin OprB
VGINVEQAVAPGLGVFVRAMISDGKSEVVAFNPADRSLAFGVAGTGVAWGRDFDVAGLGLGLAWISAAHARYLALGGVDGFIGDGYLRQAVEGVAEAFYSVNLRKAIWLAADYQVLWHPGMNADRGPVHIPGGKLHAEF